jgi:chromosome partitioning protein
MTVIVVANPKGGVGKSTLATNLAGALAAMGEAVSLGDVDRQQSAQVWLSLRSAELATIASWDLDPDKPLRPPRASSYAVLDTPAGLHGHRFDAVMKVADKLIIPLQPSLFDIQASFDFVAALRSHKRAAEVQVVLVGMRVREHAHSTEHLHDFLSGLKLPLLTDLRDTQNYVHLAAHGLTLWDVAPGKVERDLEQWQPLLRWVLR